MLRIRSKPSTPSGIPKVRDKRLALDIAPASRRNPAGESFILSNSNAGPRALALSSTTVPISLFQSAPSTALSSPCASTSASHDRKPVFIFAPESSIYRQDSFHFAQHFFDEARFDKLSKIHR